jgi:hypothetical protein
MASVRRAGIARGALIGVPFSIMPICDPLAVNLETHPEAVNAGCDHVWVKKYAWVNKRAECGNSGAGP